MKQLLIGRLDGLEAPQVAAFVSGWQSALELVARTDLSIPEAPPELRAAVEELARNIDRAQRACLDRGDDQTPSG